MICQVTILIIETDSGPSKKKNPQMGFPNKSLQKEICESCQRYPVCLFWYL